MGKRRLHSAEFKAKVAVAAERSDVERVGVRVCGPSRSDRAVEETGRGGAAADLRDPPGHGGRRPRGVEGGAVSRDRPVEGWSWTGSRKNTLWSTTDRRAAVDPTHPELSVARQWALVDLPRSLFYDAPVPITEGNLTLMRVLAEQYTATPFYGSGRMQVALQRAGYLVNRKHVQRLMRLMGLEAVGPKPRLSEAHPGLRVYPYLLRNVPIVRVDQV